MSQVEVSAKDVMKLRQKTGLSMMECKKALAEAGGDQEAAEALLRKKLKGKMETRTDRAAGEGRIGVSIQGDQAAIVELRAETDFTAKNDKFVEVTQAIADAVRKAQDGKALPQDAQAALDEIRITTGENISYARGKAFSGGTFASYVHHDGKTGVLLQVEGDADPAVLKDICMHIVAAVPVPMGVSAEDVPAEVVEKERKFRLEQAMESGKPKEIAEKMVEGGMRKFFESVALLEQPFVKDPSKPIKELLGSGTKILHFERWVVGETDAS
ncbi:MAG: elongation factor Ts [Phycisphaerales bacterium]|nr:MAG: elongation factor Ts [Phycisphaerales bacterium]